MVSGRKARDEREVIVSSLSLSLLLVRPSRKADIPTREKGMRGDVYIPSLL